MKTPITKTEIDTTVIGTREIPKHLNDAILYREERAVATIVEVYTDTNDKALSIKTAFDGSSIPEKKQASLIQWAETLLNN